ncbi:hypothetical protein [Actinomadura alba]|uniref:Uncharacterized protein n=1 Tax=Actinomadura alba TaxID=406431 RepID=A0ABR7LZ01_9ACTN|nr:hypothetical protein [Actinomadura alba]MBC6469722.1 hypothetical protein [Actinomadura alba]
MTDQLEETLKTTLGTASRRAPEPWPDLLRQVERRHRRRRVNRAGTALVTVIALVGGGITAGQALFQSGPPEPQRVVSPADASLPTPPPEQPVPVGSLWPQAVRSVPDTLPGDGRKYVPRLLVDDHTLLATTGSGSEKVDELWLYDVEKARANRLATVPSAGDVTISASGFTSGEGRIAWWQSVKTQNVEVTEIWAVPLTGGEPRVVTRAPTDPQADTRIESLTITGGKVVWSTGSGVYEAPLAGGTARLLPDTEGHHIVRWPWIGTPGIASTRVPFKVLRNVRTGERRDTKPTSELLACGVTWCAGSDGVSDIVQRRDGTKGHTVLGGGSDMGTKNLPGLDRFLFAVVPARLLNGRQPFPPGTYLYDLETRKIADLGVTPTSNRTGLSDPGARLYSYAQGEGRYALIDLAKIK